MYWRRLVLYWALSAYQSTRAPIVLRDVWYCSTKVLRAVLLCYAISGADIAIDHHHCVLSGTDILTIVLRGIRYWHRCYVMSGTDLRTQGEGITCERSAECDSGRCVCGVCAGSNLTVPDQATCDARFVARHCEIKCIRLSFPYRLYQERRARV